MDAILGCFVIIVFLITAGALTAATAVEKATRGGMGRVFLACALVLVVMWVWP